MTRPNILLVVWDACRAEAARDHAPTLASLAAENLRFENAITPAGYSLPAHASMFTGQYLHEHGIFSREQEFDAVPLVDDLRGAGYTCYGVSANGFASPRYRFDEPFDVFYNTQGQMVYPDGLDVHRYARDAADDGAFSAADLDYLDLLRATLRHPHPLRSVANVAAAAVSELASSYPLLQRIPHPRFNEYHEFAYTPEKNTDAITSVLEREATTAEPFFLFTNYMDTHHPYAPPERFQRETCGRTFSYRELVELADVSHPWDYLRRVESGDRLPERTLADLRGLYAGEVRRVDEHLGRLLDALDRTGLREDTLIVVTADHGENLGETDRMGENRMGHECSASERLLRVPLVLAHPDLDAREVTDYVSLKDLATLFMGGLDRLIESGGADCGALTPDDGVVASQVPPPANPTLRERYPEIADVLTRTLSVTYADDWKVVVTSDGDRHCWHRDEERSLDDAPERAVDRAESHLATLVEQSDTDRELSDARVSQLESLGYL